MKNLLKALVLLTFLGQLFSVTVDGYAYLEDATNFRGINVIFQRVVPDSLALYRVSTDSTGYFVANIESGYYDIEYAKNGYSTTKLEDVPLYSNQTLSNQTLTARGLEGEIKGILTEGEYNVSNTLTVPEGDSLIIEPGVILNFQTDTQFNVNGYLKAEGTVNDSIIFRSLDLTGTSLGIGLNSVSTFKYCKIMNLEKSLMVGLRMNGSLKISDTYIKAAGICIRFAGEEDGARIDMENVVIEGDIGIYHTQTGTVSLKNCQIQKCNYGLYTVVGMGVSWIIDNSLISAGIHGIYSDIAYCNIVVYNSTVFVEDTGLKLTFQSNNIEVSNSIIKGVEYGIYILNDLSKGYSGTRYVSNSNILGQTGNFYNCGSILGVIVTTNANGDPCDGYFNTSMDPLFLDEWNGDFMLTEGSPCIDAGTNTISGYTFPLTDIIGNKRIWDGDENSTSIVDIGAYEYGSSIPVSIEDTSEKIQNCQLFQNYPNPFNPVTTISYALPQASQVELNVYNLNGQLVQSLVNGRLDKGIHKAEFSGADLTSGMYIYNLKVDNKVVSSKKMMLLK